MRGAALNLQAEEEKELREYVRHWEKDNWGRGDSCQLMLFEAPREREITSLRERKGRRVKTKFWREKERGGRDRKATWVCLSAVPYSSLFY